MELSVGNKRIHIPLEILRLIFHSHDMRKDVKTARLVCTKFEFCASPYLIDTAIVGSQTETLERFKAIARHHVFSKTVTTVVFSACPLEREYATADEYYQDLRTNYTGSKNIPTREQCERHWREYQILYKDQAKLQREGDDETSIREALQYMPKIKHVVMSSRTWKLASHPLNKAWRPPDYHIIEPGGDPPNGPWQVSHGFNIMSSALLSNGMRLSSLTHAQPRRTSDCLRSGCFSEKTQEIFRPLRKIALILQRHLSLKSVGECVSTATELEHLEIGLVNPTTRHMRSPEIFLTTWPKLHHLKLGISIDYDLFVSFCHSHVESLRSLHIQHVHLFGETWGKLINVMKDCLQLTDIWLEGLSEEAHRDCTWGRRDDSSEASWERLSEAEEYILRGGENPFTNNMFELVAG